MSTRKTFRYFDAITLGADSDLSLARTITVGRDGYISLQGYLDNGSAAAPSDTPVGVIELHASAVGTRFTIVTGTIITTELAKIAANGNLVVDAWSIVIGAPGTAVKFRYKRSSGGAGNSRYTLDVVTW